MRLFAAVLPPEEAVEELAARAAGLRGLPGAEALRWTERAGWHFTLAFYGEVGEGAVPELSGRLARAAGRTAPFRLALRGAGRFGDRVLWVGVSGDAGALRVLAGRGEAAGRKAGLPVVPAARHVGAGWEPGGWTFGRTWRRWRGSRGVPGRCGTCTWSAAGSPPRASRANARGTSR